MGYLINSYGLLISIVGIKLEANTTDCRYGAQEGGEQENLGRELSPGLGVGSGRQTGLHVTICVACLPHSIMSCGPEESGSVHCFYALCVEHRTGT